MRKISFKNRKNQAGLTLIEMVVTLGVFAFAMTEIMGVYMAILRVDEKSRGVRLVEQNARFITEFIIRETRNGVINYGTPPGNYAGAVPTPSTELRLINADNEQERIYLSGGTLVLEKFGVGSSNLSGAQVTVSNVRFYVRPTDGTTTTVQPQVTFSFTVAADIGVHTPTVVRRSFQSSAITREYHQ